MAASCGTRNRDIENLGGASEPRPGPSTIDPFSRRPPSCFYRTQLDRGGIRAGVALQEQSSMVAQHHVPLLATQCSPLVSANRRTGIQVSHNTESSVSIDSLLSPRSIRRHFAFAERNVKQQSARFFCVEKSAKNFANALAILE